MTNWLADTLGGLGLPQGLPEMLDDNLDYRGHDRSICRCWGCLSLNAFDQDYINSRRATLKEGWARFDVTMRDLASLRGHQSSDAPYSFWLGADHG